MPNHGEDAKIAFIISYLSGSACQWVQSYLEVDMLGNQVELWLHDTTVFWREMNARYGQLNEGDNHRQELKKLRQKGTVQDYLIEFQRLLVYLGYNNITLHDMFYDHLSMEVKQSMLAQSFDPAGVTTFNQVAERALLIDMHIQQFAKVEKPKHASSPCATTTAHTTTTTTTQATTTKTLLSKGDQVFTIGTDGRATCGKVTKIAENAKGFNAPWVKRAGQEGKVKMTFNSLKKDTWPAPSTPSDPKGPGPMDIDSAGKGKVAALAPSASGEPVGLSAGSYSIRCSYTSNHSVSKFSCDSVDRARSDE
ncbi:hypothetical protein FRC09_016336 [Ceratobasidium sp. 395]|nr:hypothetical protein FRC09_016336 [Ceratobasidium sp. 395]